MNKEYGNHVTVLCEELDGLSPTTVTSQGTLGILDDGNCHITEITYCRNTAPQFNFIEKAKDETLKFKRNKRYKRKPWN